MIIPQLTYALPILPSPGELFLNDIEKIILNFFWDDKPAKIKKTILFKEKTEGGLNLTNIFKLPFIVTQNTKLQWLQYRINQRILGTNKLLYKIKVKDNAFCTFCQEDEETIEHLFWNCEIVQAFIDEIDSWLFSNGVSIPFTMQFFLFGDTSKSSRGDAINLILLQIKQYIFNCKYFQKKLSLVTMQRKIQSLYNIEKSIAIKNKKIDFFNQIWNAFTLLFN